MLILTGRVGETIKIGNDVNVTVLGCNGNQVRLGVDAPNDVAVHREEIYERIKSERSIETKCFAWRASTRHGAISARARNA